MTFEAIFHLRKTFRLKKTNTYGASKEIISKCQKNQNGQSFVEFLFLLLILMGLSISMVTGFNGSVAKRWKAIVEAVAIPNDTDSFEL